MEHEGLIYSRVLPGSRCNPDTNNKGTKQEINFIGSRVKGCFEPVSAAFRGSHLKVAPSASNMVCRHMAFHRHKAPLKGQGHVLHMQMVVVMLAGETLRRGVTSSQVQSACTHNAYSHIFT